VTARLRERSPLLGVLGIGLLLVLAPVRAHPEVVTTDLFIVPEGQPIGEDVYVAATEGRVEGTIDGDLVILAGAVTISGRVTGNVLALGAGRVVVASGGRVDGSLRVAAREVAVSGSVGGDVAATAMSTTIDGNVARDVIAFGGTLRIDGRVGRDVRGRVLDGRVAGDVGRDVDLAVERLTVTAGAHVAGDLLYRSPTAAGIAPEAVVAGQTIRLPTRSNFVFGVILTLLQIVGFLGFLVVGILVLWLARHTGAGAVAMMRLHPWRAVVVGVAAAVAVPATLLLLSATLVGLPLAVVVLLAVVVALVLGPVPAVTALGEVVLRGRGGLFGAFLLGAVAWRLGIWVVPVFGGVLYLVALVWGTGAWLLAAWEERSREAPGRELLPASMRVVEEIPPDWEPPLPPAPPSAAARGDVGGPAPGDFPEEEGEERPEPPPGPARGEDTDDWGLPRHGR